MAHDSALVAIFLSDKHRAAALAAELSALGHRCFVTANSDELNEKAAAESIDLLVIDHQLKGFLTGLEILRHLQKNMVNPVSVVLVPHKEPYEAEAQSLGVHRLCISTMTVSALVNVIKPLLVTAIKSRPITGSLARSLVARAGHIEPLPQLMVRMAELLRNGCDSPDELYRDVAIDPKASAEILRVANSSAVGRAHRTSSLIDAIRFLGTRRTMSVVLSAGLVKAQSGLVSQLPRNVRTWYGHRSVLIAGAAEAFARNLEKISPETAYVMGLLQDIGILVLAGVYGDRYLELLKRVREIAHLKLEAEELAVLGISHHDVSAALLQKWGLQDFMVSIVAGHHQPIPNAELPPVDEAFIRVMQIGEAVAGISDRHTPQRYIRLNQLLSHYRKSDANACRTSLEEGIAKVTESAKLLSIPVPSDRELGHLTSDLQKHAECDLSEEELARAAKIAEDTYQRDHAPVDLIPEDSDQDEDEEQKIIPGRPTLLVIEDEKLAVKIIRMMLKPYELQVLHASNFEEAHELSPSVDMILCDVHLQDEDGIDVINRLKVHGFSKPVLMMSADRRREVVQRAIWLGITGYLVKPFSTPTLVDKLRAGGLLLECPSPV
ncbi:MAG: HDOD domain-containing protein [Pirellulaceae bacterium]